MFILAENLGRSVADIEQHMSLREIAEWRAFYNLREKEKERFAKQAEKEQRTEMLKRRAEQGVQMTKDQLKGY